MGTSCCGSVSAKRLDELDSNGVDVIVIGSGIGGLTCAAALAKVRVLHALSEHAVVLVSETPLLGCLLRMQRNATHHQWAVVRVHNNALSGHCENDGRDVHALTSDL
jgi:glycine/D-amino acid oxidase-like deaminating enzyme